ncbi:hypothetical protein ACH4SK_13935 [Streptomyces inhibens]
MVSRRCGGRSPAPVGRAAAHRDGVVAIGDSITDGYGATPDTNNRN